MPTFKFVRYLSLPPFFTSDGFVSLISQDLVSAKLPIGLQDNGFIGAVEINSRLDPFLFRHQRHIRNLDRINGFLECRLLIFQSVECPGSLCMGFFLLPD
jgi:hypothetical protein